MREKGGLLPSRASTAGLADPARPTHRYGEEHGYPPDKQERATQAVLEQAEVLSEAWAVA